MFGNTSQMRQEDRELGKKLKPLGEKLQKQTGLLYSTYL